MNLSDLKERDYYDSLLGKGKGDPDNVRWIGEDKAVLERHTENPHWSELPKSVFIFPPRDFGDNDKSDPENNLEETL